MQQIKIKNRLAQSIDIILLPNPGEEKNERVRLSSGKSITVDESRIPKKEKPFLEKYCRLTQIPDEATMELAPLPEELPFHPPLPEAEKEIPEPTMEPAPLPEEIPEPEPKPRKPRTPKQS